MVVGLDFSRAFANRQLIQPRGRRKPLADFGPWDQQLFGRRRARVVGSGLFEARLGLVDQSGGLSRSVLFFNNDERQIAIGRKVVKEGRRARFLGQRNDRGLIERLNRALRGRIVPPDRFDGLADELDANRIVGPCGKKIDDAAANAEFAVLVDRILAGEAGVGQKVSQHDGIQIHSIPELDGSGFETVGGAEPRQ